MQPTEIIEGDLANLNYFMRQLTRISAEATDSLTRIELHVTLDGQDFVIGYGESAEPAILLRPTNPDA